MRKTSINDEKNVTILKRIETKKHNCFDMFQNLKTLSEYFLIFVNNIFLL